MATYKKEIVSKKRNTKKNKDSKEYLKDFLRISPFSHALWRTIEALSFEKVEMESPVLDLGCGFGEFAGVVFNQIEVGIDVNEDDLKKALDGKRYKKLLYADARNLPFKDNSYKTVVSVSVMEHIESCEKVIKEVHRVLKKGGKFVFSVPTPEMKEYLLVYSFLKSIGLKDSAESYWKFHKNIFKHVNLQTHTWWEDKLKKAGFEIVKKEGTLSPTHLRLHEAFLVTALPSQIGKTFVGKRLVMMVDFRSKILPFLFGGLLKQDTDSNINMFFVARKK